MLCSCHGEEMYQRPDGRYWYCRVKRREASRRWKQSEAGREYQRKRRESGAMAQGRARQLLRGDQIRILQNHHAGVAVLLGERPGGMHVSRVCLDGCPDSWIGHSYRRGEKIPYTLCIPEHYAWETPAENLARKGRAA
jgi:hypothetical protein